MDIKNVKITYKITGNTHNGYCSDPEEDCETELQFETETKELDNPIPLSFFNKKGFLKKSKFPLKFFDVVKYGCFTGSGYCVWRNETETKYKRNYTAIKVEKME